MSKAYRALEGPINEYIIKMAAQDDRVFFRTVRIVDKPADLSINKRLVRVHRDTLQFTPLNELATRIFDLCDEFDDINIRRKKEAVADAREITDDHLFYLLRSDPEFTKWFQDLILRLQKVQSNVPMFTSHIVSGGVQPSGRIGSMPTLPRHPSTGSRQTGGETSDLHPY